MIHIDRITRRPLRLIIGGVHRLARLFWFFTRPRTFGAHAVALTPEGQVVLVKLRYAPGWRLPGGGRKASEHPADAVIRELREEIGLISYSEVRLAGELQESPDFKRDTASLLIVRDVLYKPRWSWEVEAVMEAPLDGLPPETSRRALKWIGAVRPMLGCAPA